MALGKRFLHGLYFIVFTLFYIVNPILGDFQQVIGDGDLFTEEKRHLDKRAIEASEEGRWTNHIVPFSFKGLGEIHKFSIKAVMQTYERFTCLKFQRWTNDTGDKSPYLHFTSGYYSCYERTDTQEQQLCCYNQHLCMVELGRALGLITESKSPSPERDYLIRYNRNNEDPAGDFFPRSASDVLTDGYDLSSYLHPHIPKRAYGQGPSYTLLFPEYNVGYGIYYMMRDVSNAHKCNSADVCPQGPKCENDGYLTKVDGKCSCRCVKGLEPASGCTKVSKDDFVFSKDEEVKFPGGKYAMPAPSSGCPDSTFILESITTGKGQLDMCVSESQETDTYWPGGNYCIFKKEPGCPNGLKKGAITFGGDSVKIEFCCKLNEFSNEELFLPSRKPMILMKYPQANIGCQAIKGMHSTVEEVTIEGDFKKSFDAPVDRDHVVHYCHYVPATINCGKVYELSSSLEQVTFSSPQDKELECVWLIKAPKGEKIVVDFTQHDVGCDEGNELEIRYDRIGYPGQRKCGKQLKENYISFNNSFYIRLSTFGGSTASFTATAKLIQTKDLCYNPADHGQSYVGTVNFTRNFQECLPWSETTHCPQHIYSQSAFGTVLEGNYCRNPDRATGVMPWCYIKSRYCERNYCDVCLHRKRVDKRSDCKDLQKEGKCDLEGCAKTCKDEYPVETPKKASSIECNDPNPVADALPVDLKAGGKEGKWAVGDRVTYTCQHDQTTTVDKICLTSGMWSSAGTACRGSDSSTKACLDYWDTCPTLFKKNPEICKKYTHFARLNCPFTCGICGKDSTPKCHNEHLKCLVRSSLDPKVSRGDSVEYTCKYGQIALTSGGVGGCQADGTMTAVNRSRVCGQGCQNGWIYNIDTRSCYKVFHYNSGVDYPTAASKCAEYGAWVVMPKTRKQSEFVRSKLYSEIYLYWIGVVYSKEQGAFLWADGEEVGRSGDWPGGYPPAAKKEQCVTVFPGQWWSAQKCSQRASYACQVPYKVNTATSGPV